METLLRVQFWNKALGRRCFVSPQPFGSYKQLPEKKYSKAGQQPCTPLHQTWSPEVRVMGISIHQHVLEPSSHLPGETSSQPLKNGATPMLKSPPQPSLG